MIAFSGRARVKCLDKKANPMDEFVIFFEIVFSSMLFLASCDLGNLVDAFIAGGVCGLCWIVINALNGNLKTKVVMRIQVKNHFPISGSRSYAPSVRKRILCVTICADSMPTVVPRVGNASFCPKPWSIT